MFVRNFMTRDPITVSPSVAATEAVARIREHRIHQLPVVDDRQRLLGIITDRDLRTALGPAGRSDARVADVMTPDPITITPDALVEEAMSVLFVRRFGSLPVVEEGRLVGIITKYDIIRAFHDLLGLNQPGTRVCVSLPRGFADFATALRVLHENTIQVAGTVATDGGRGRGTDPPALWIRVASLDPTRAIECLRSAGLTVLAPGAATVGAVPANP